MNARTATSRRYYDARFDAYLTAVAPGDHGTTSEPSEMLTTLLGSCVSACILDVDKGIGGMNHFLLPKSPKSNPDERDIQSLSYGDHAMEVLINALLKGGARRGALRAKVFGGAAMHSSMETFEVGKRNIRFVEDFLAREGIPVTARDVGGNASRRIVFHPSTGKVHVNQLTSSQISELVSSETRYAREIAKPRASTLELF